MDSMYLKLEIWKNGICIETEGGEITEKQYKNVISKLFDKLRAEQEKKKK